MTVYLYFRDAIRAQLISEGVIGDDAYVVIAGPANTYGHYVATIEEYSVQRYEGASTLFGPRSSLLLSLTTVVLKSALQIPWRPTLKSTRALSLTWQRM